MGRAGAPGRRSSARAPRGHRVLPRLERPVGGAGHRLDAAADTAGHGACTRHHPRSRPGQRGSGGAQLRAGVDVPRRPVRADGAVRRPRQGPARRRRRPVRVIAGEFKGRRLHTARGAGTRPTADRVREALFSMLGDVSGARVLDLYAGSGALGIEALSRGAEAAVFLERDDRALAALKWNLDAVGAEAEVRSQDALRFMAHPEGVFDLVFCDPPYDDAPRVAGPLSEALPAMTGADARIVTESD